MKNSASAVLPAAIGALLLLALLAGGCHSLGGQRLYPDGGSDTGTDETSVGALVSAVHHNELDYADGEEAGIVWLPLPIDHATQVPLYVELVVDPPAIVEQVSYQLDAYRNFGAVVELVVDDTADGVSFHWEAVVVTRDVSSQERPIFYAATNDPQEWTVATPVADASHEGIAAVAAAITATSPTPLQRMEALLEWTSTNIDYPSDWSGIESLDATATFELGESSSTGFANLATALGRALGLPTRTIGDLYVGELGVGQSQQTHYMNEFYLGEELGWRRVEPQATVTVLPEEYALALRIAVIDDEGDAAFADELWSYPGVPLRSMVYPVAGYSRMIWNYEPQYFADCATCDNRAELVAALEGTQTAMAVVFDRARELWQRDLEAYVDGTLDQQIMDARRAALEATTLDDITAILDQID
jgi:transglutaminase-like putative cysteine protease